MSSTANPLWLTTHYLVAMVNQTSSLILIQLRVDRNDIIVSGLMVSCWHDLDTITRPADTAAQLDKYETSPNGSIHTPFFCCHCSLISPPLKEYSSYLTGTEWHKQTYFVLDEKLTFSPLLKTSGAFFLLLFSFSLPSPLSLSPSSSCHYPGQCLTKNVIYSRDTYILFL